MDTDGLVQGIFLTGPSFAAWRKNWHVILGRCSCIGKGQTDQHMARTCFWSHWLFPKRRKTVSKTVSNRHSASYTCPLRTSSDTWSVNNFRAFKPFLFTSYQIDRFLPVSAQNSIHIHVVSTYPKRFIYVLGTLSLSTSVFCSRLIIQTLLTGYFGWKSRKTDIFS